MRIVLLPLTKDGCHWYRNFQPYEEIKRQGLAEVFLLSDDDIKSGDERITDLLISADYIVGRFCHKKYIDWLDKYAPGKKIIIDNDDYVFNPDPYGSIYQAYGTQEVKHGNEWLWKDGEDGFHIQTNLERIKEDTELVNRADILTVSTPRLKEVYKHKNCKVVYNALDFNIWKPYEVKKTEFRIGWSGGSTHYSDMYTVKDDLEYLLNKYPHVKLVLSGTPFTEMFRVNPKQIETAGWIDISGHPYRSILQNLDLAFIPLAKNEFNKYKSCIKWYEYASIGVPTVAVNYPPYSDEMPAYMLYDNFRQEMENYIKNSGLRNKNAEEGKKWVKQNRDIKVIAKDLYDFLCK